jgi:hypothetical protein
MPNSNNITSERRQLLKTMAFGLTTGAVGVNLITSASAKPENPQASHKSASHQRGYRETQHILDYYNTL